nr:hypothetical protein [Marinicella sp. W31]MDC2877247.1 hypothetical protein [Marinicella sp. W31]
MYTTAYLSSADWNDTHFDNEQFDELLIEAKGELDQATRKQQYSQMASILRDEGGLICPMFNEFVQAYNEDVQGWEENGVFELMNGLAPLKCWKS